MASIVVYRSIKAFLLRSNQSPPGNCAIVVEYAWVAASSRDFSQFLAQDFYPPWACIARLEHAVDKTPDVELPSPQKRL